MHGKGIGGEEVGLEERAIVKVEVRGRAARDDNGVESRRVGRREPVLNSMSCKEARC